MSNVCGWMVAKWFARRNNLRNFVGADGPVPKTSPLNDSKELPDKSKLSNFSRLANVFGWMSAMLLLFRSSFRSEFSPKKVPSLMFLMLFWDRSRCSKCVSRSNEFDEMMSISLLLKSSSCRRTPANPRNRWAGIVCMLLPDKSNFWRFWRPFKQSFSSSFIEFCETVNVCRAPKPTKPSDGN